MITYLSFAFSLICISVLMKQFFNYVVIGLENFWPLTATLLIYHPNDTIRKPSLCFTM